MPTTATNRRKTAATRRSTTAKKAATTRAANRGAAARQTAERRASAATERVVERNRTRAEQLGDYAERAILIPVGVALEARDRIVGDLNSAWSTYGTPTRAQTQLRRFERRGNTARRELEREVRKTRTRFERELRERRDVARRISSRVELASAQVENALQTQIKNGTQLATRLQERVLDRF